MHPLLQARRRILYVLAWGPVCGMLVVFLRQAGELSWIEATVMGVPLCGVYAIVCLSAWYICRQVPLTGQGLVRVLAAPVVASGAAASLWVGLSRLLAAAIASTTGFLNLEERMARTDTWLWATGTLLYLLAVCLSYLLAELEAVRQAKDREVRALVVAREAELKALRDQVSPHFLFNSLNSISALVSVDKQKARQMCVLLADFLRRSLGVGDRPLIPLDEELSMVRDYLCIEQVRFDQRLRWEESVDEQALPLLIPPLLLQPLVENAIKHGIAQLIEGGVVRLEAQLGELDLRIAVTNTYDPDTPPSKGAGVGLENIRRRLHTIYGAGARLETSTLNGQYRAEVRMLKETRR